MPKIISSAGEMNMSLTSIGIEGDTIVVKGKMGVWDSKMIVTPLEAVQTMRLMINVSLIFYLFKLPFLLLKRKK